MHIRLPYLALLLVFAFVAGRAANPLRGAAWITAATPVAEPALERLLARFPDFEVDAAAGRFAPGGFVRRYESLPFRARA